jgi:hypothetical protein
VVIDMDETCGSAIPSATGEPAKLWTDPRSVRYARNLTVGTITFPPIKDLPQAHRRKFQCTSRGICLCEL